MEYKFLDKIKSPADIKDFDTEKLNVLCEEIRDCLITTVSKNGGHLASNLGAVELTVALHKAFNTPQDKIVFDVGHQCYTHKLLTGRYDKFSSLRKEGGLSGFMRPDESEYDPFITGHSSNSISASFGIYKGIQLAEKRTDRVVAVIGDGAMTGGLAYEGLNNAGSGKNQSMIVVLNDNKMSISGNVGGLARYLGLIRSKPSYHRFKHNLERIIAHIPLIGRSINRNLLRSKNMLKNAIYHSNIFEDMGFHYLGPVDGHNLESLEQIFKVAKEQTRPVLVHVLTVKGKGYHFAENQPKNYHGVSPFDVEQGAGDGKKLDFSAAIGDELVNLARSDEKLAVITAAMTEGTGLSEFSKRYKNRFFDVGIAEEHAVTFAGGLASVGAHPVFVVYSSFLQRAYDQIIHDTAVAGLPVTICVDRAGIVGDDGETHQGLFDIAFLKTVPGMEIYAPSDYLEAKSFLRKSIYNIKTPSAVRYPRGCQLPMPDDYKFSGENFSLYGKKSAKKVIVTFGRTFQSAAGAVADLKEQGKDVAVLKLNRLYPIEENFYDEIKSFDEVYIFEEGIKSGGINETILSGLALRGLTPKVSVTAIENQFVRHSSVDSALKKYSLDRESICKIVG